MRARTAKKPLYTEVPPVSDENYWKLKEKSSDGKTIIYVPIDRELHHKLLVELRAKREAAKLGSRDTRHGLKELRP